MKRLGGVLSKLKAKISFH